MKINLQTFAYSPQKQVLNQNFKTTPVPYAKNTPNADTVSFQGLSSKNRRCLSMIMTLICATTSAGVALCDAFTQPKQPSCSIEEQGEIQTPNVPEDIVIDTRSDEEKFEEAKEALIQAVSGYETCATQWALYGSKTSLDILKDKKENPDYSNFLNAYENLITFNKDVFPGLDPKYVYDIGDDIKDTEKMLDLIRSTVFSALYTHSNEGGYNFSSLTALNDVSRSEWHSIMNLLNSILYSKETDDDTKQAAQIYKDEIMKTDSKMWARPSSFYKKETLEEEIDGNEALRAYLTENVDSIKETAKELAELRAAFKFSETTDGLSKEYKELDALYLEACENKDFEAQIEIRSRQSEAYREHYIGTSFPAYQAYYEAYNNGIVLPLEEIWPDLKFANISTELFNMVQAIANAENRLKDEMGITSGFNTKNQTPEKPLEITRTTKFKN